GLLSGLGFGALGAAFGVGGAFASLASGIVNMFESAAAEAERKRRAEIDKTVAKQEAAAKEDERRQKLILELKKQQFELEKRIHDLNKERLDRELFFEQLRATSEEQQKQLERGNEV